MIGTELPGILESDRHTLDGFPQPFTSHLIENLKLNTYYTMGAFAPADAGTMGGLPAVIYRSKLGETLYIEMHIKFTEQFRAEFNRKADMERQSRRRPLPLSRRNPSMTVEQQEETTRNHHYVQWILKHNPAFPDNLSLVWSLRKVIFGPCDCLAVMEVCHFAPDGELLIQQLYPRDIEDIVLIVPPRQRPLPLSLTATLMALGRRKVESGQIRCRITFTEEFVLKYHPDNPQRGRWGYVNMGDLSPGSVFYIVQVETGSSDGHGGIEKIEISHEHRSTDEYFWIRGNDVESLVIDTSTPVLD